MNNNRILLPEIKETEFSLETLLNLRYSERSFSSAPISLVQISNILWAGYGKNKWGKITSPSAGAFYPITLYLISKNIDGLGVGIYRYNPESHSLIKISNRDVQVELYRAALLQDSIKEAQAIIVITVDYNVTTSKYGKRGTRYVHMEVGHVAQNIYLEVTALKLGTVEIGAFYDDEVKQILDIPESPLILMPIGYPLE